MASPGDVAQMSTEGGKEPEDFDGEEGQAEDVRGRGQA